MRGPRFLWTLILGLFVAPAGGPLLAQQPADPVRPAIDSLLDLMEAEATLRDLESRFLGEVILLVPGLDAEQQQALSDAVATAFAPAAMREDVLNAMTEDAPPALARDLLARHRSGALGELARTAAGFQPQGTVNDYIAGLGTPPRERLQRMVQLAEREGRAEVQLVLEESIQGLGHQLVGLLGGDLPEFQRMSDEQFQARYRDRTLQRGFANLHRLQPASDDLLDRALADLESEAGQWYVDAYFAAVLSATNAAAGRVAELTMLGDEQPAAPVDEGLHCQGIPCLVWVDWNGPEPDAFNSRYGAPGALGARVMDHLGAGSFRLGGSSGEQAFMVRLDPRLTTANCDFMAGTNSESCQVVGEVRVEFRGSYQGLANPPGFTVLNRCGADGVLDVERLGAFVAARVLHALHRPTEPAPSNPPC